MGSVKFTFTTRDEDLDKSYAKIGRENAKLREDLAKAKRASEEANDASKRGLLGNIDLTKRMRTELVSMATGWVGVTQAIAVYNQERERQIALDAKSKGVQLTVGQAEASLVKNFGDAPITDINAFISSMEKVNTDKKFGNLAAILEASATTLSATGGNRNLTRGLITEGAGIFRDDPTQLPLFASALGDVARIMDAQTPEDYKKAMGLVLSTQSVARIEDLKSFENVAPALSAVANIDTSGDAMGALRSGAAAYAALGGTIGDKRGAIAGTGIIQLASQLNELLPDQDILGVGGEVIRSGTGLKTLEERIRAVQGDVELQREFFYGDKPASFEGKTADAVKALLMNPESQIAKAFTANLAAINPDVALVERLNTNLASTKRGKFTSIQSEIDTAIESGALNDTEGTRRALVRQTYDELSQRAQPGWSGYADRLIARGFFEGGMMMGMAPERAAQWGFSSMDPRNSSFGFGGGDPKFDAINQQFFEIMSKIEVNTRNPSALPDQLNSQGQRR